MCWKCLSQQSIKFKVANSDYNSAIVESLCIALPTALLELSPYLGFYLSCEVIEHIILYLSVLSFMIKSSNIVPWNLEHMDVLYHGPLFKKSGLLS